MDSTAYAAIQGLLDGDEKLLWSGQPGRGLRVRPQDTFALLFGLIWCFGVSSMVFADKRHPDISGPPILFIVIFLFFGLYAAFGRFFVDAWNRGRTSYGVTNDRIIIVGRGAMAQTKSLQLRTLADISLTEKSDGSGTITFGPTNTGWASGTGWGRTNRHGPPAFEFIENAREVYGIVQRAQKALFPKA